MPAYHHTLSPDVATSDLTLAAEVFPMWRSGRVVHMDKTGITVDGEIWQSLDVAQVSNPARPGNEAVFRIEGKICRISFDGKEVCLPALKGLRYIHYLIQHPWEDVHSSALVAMFNGEAPVCGDDGTKEALLNGTLNIEEERRETVLTPEQRAHAEKHLQELKSDLAFLKNNDEPTEQVESEIEKCEEYLAKVGYGNHAAKIPTQADWDRKSVGKAIRNAIKSVTKIYPALGYFLNKSFKCGFFILYKPIKPINWEK